MFQKLISNGESCTFENCASNSNIDYFIFSLETQFFMQSLQWFGQNQIGPFQNALKFNHKVDNGIQEINKQVFTINT
jgi:hypothetical protein